MKQNPDIPALVFRGQLAPNDFLGFYAMAVVSSFAIVALPAVSLLIIYGGGDEPSFIWTACVLLMAIPIVVWLIPATVRRMRNAGHLGSLIGIVTWALAICASTMVTLPMRTDLSSQEVILIVIAPNALFLSGIFCLPAGPVDSLKRRKLGLCALAVISTMSAVQIFEMMFIN
jgi:hydrogenase-4 membrane subunit HyfE